MAASIVSHFIKRLDTLITEEASLLLGVEEQLSLLLSEFKFIKSCLKDADRKRSKSDLVEVWVTEIRDIAYDAEDVIDAYILHLEQRKALNSFKKTFYSWKKLQTLHRTGKKIEQINVRARRISTCRSDYNIDVAETSNATDISYIRRGIPTAEEIDVVGFLPESTQIIKLLKEEVHQRQVISIIGMGGLGKTTLAQKVYKNYDVTHCFDIRIWITVSQDYQVRDVLLSVLKQVLGYPSSGSETNEELKEELCKQLMNKKYLVIIDDIWKVEAWDQIIGVFPSNDKASRFILTTRNKEVALHADPIRGNLIELPFLNEEESWELFCKKVFHLPIAACPPELVKLGKEIAEKCGGLPLAILVIGGLLRGKGRTPDEWSTVAETVSWYLSQDSNMCRQILTLSYSDLPYYLKPCFLYLSIFLEDDEIYARRLIRLWIAEGFVDARRQVSMEVVAGDYLEELVQRNLIQVTRRWYQGGSVIRFRVHDLLRDLAIAESRKDRFIEICNKNDPPTSSARPRRLAIHSSKEKLDEFYTSTPPNLRCLLLSNHGLPKFSDGNKMLRVLDVQGNGTWKDIGNILGNLIFLQYLRISDNDVKSLPSSICNLVKLHSLNIRRTGIRVLPKSIWKLKNLRRLLLPTNCCKKVEGSVGMKDFGMNLHSLEVSGKIWMNNDGTGLSNILVKHGRLRVLHVLGKLTLSNDGMNLKNSFPSTITEVNLSFTHIEEDPSYVLGSLPTLKALILGQWFYKGREMVFCSGRFSQLQYLAICGFYDLCEWRVEDGSMPILRNLIIENLWKLRKLPNELRNVSTLQKLEVFNAPQLEERIKENGEDWNTVRHIPNLRYNPKSSGYFFWQLKI